MIPLNGCDVFMSTLNLMWLSAHTHTYTQTYNFAFYLYALPLRICVLHASMHLSHQPYTNNSNTSIMIIDNDDDTCGCCWHSTTITKAGQATTAAIATQHKYRISIHFDCQSIGNRILFRLVRDCVHRANFTCVYIDYCNKKVFMPWHGWMILDLRWTGLSLVGGWGIRCHFFSQSGVPSVILISENGDPSGICINDKWIPGRYFMGWNIQMSCNRLIRQNIQIHCLFCERIIH